MDGKALLVPVADASFGGLVRGNSTVEDILDCLLEDTTEDKIVDFLCEKYKGERDIIREDVSDIVSRLKKIGALDD